MTSTTLADWVFKSGTEREEFLRRNPATSTIVRVAEDLPLDDIPQNSMLFIATSNVAYMNHGLHEFPAKYIPQVPKWAIRKYSKEGQTILDPMCGSGTTLVEARLNSRNSYGIDIEPLACLLSKVKTTPLDPSQLRHEHHALLNRIRRGEKVETALRDFPNRDYWFRPEVTKDLANIKGMIDEIGDIDVRDFFLVCLSSIIKRVSNADPEFVYALAYSKQMRKLDQQGRTINVEREFEKTCEKQLPGMIEFCSKASKQNFCAVCQGDARRIELDADSIDLAVTSPPYINAVDYVRAHKLEMYWLGLIRTSTLELQQNFIGTERVKVSDYGTVHHSGIGILDDAVDRIYAGGDKRRAFVVFKFFDDMKQNLVEIRRVLRRGGRYVVVIGDGKVRGENVPTHEILSSIAKQEGFTLERTFGYIIRGRHMKIPRQGIGGLIEADWIVTLQK